MEWLGWIFSPVFTLIGVLLGWFLSNRTQEKLLKISEIRNELEKAYGTLYSIVSRPDEMVKINEDQERRVLVSEEEKKELDRILMSYPHMFPHEITVLWRTEIRGIEPCRVALQGPRFSRMSLGDFKDLWGIPVDFKDKITREYEKRLEEYYKITGRWKSVKDVPKWARV